jgi:hypothetical protein
VACIVTLGVVGVAAVLVDPKRRLQGKLLDHLS